MILTWRFNLIYILLLFLVSFAAVFSAGRRCFIYTMFKLQQIFSMDIISCDFSIFWKIVVQNNNKNTLIIKANKSIFCERFKIQIGPKTINTYMQRTQWIEYDEKNRIKQFAFNCKYTGHNERKKRQAHNKTWMIWVKDKYRNENVFYRRRLWLVCNESR